MLKAAVREGTKFSETFSASATTDASVNQASKLEYLLNSSSHTFLRSVLQMIIGIIFAARVDPTAGVYFFALIPVMFSIDNVTTTATKNSRESAKLERELSSKISNLNGCLPVTRACNAGDWILERMKQPLEDFQQSRQTGLFWSNFVQNYYVYCASIYQALIIIPYGIIAIRGAISTGDFVTLMNLTSVMVQPLTRFGGFLRNGSDYSGALQAIDDLIKQGNSLAEETTLDAPKSTASSLQPLTKEVQTKEVSFRYDQSISNVLQDIQLTISKGAYVVLCGPSGSGKSTVLQLLMRFRKPVEGSVSWDGVDLNTTSLESFRQHVSVMFQQTMILVGTVRENITFGLDEVPGGLEKAAEMAEIADFIQSLPHGYDTVIGGGAVGMSGGQLQRIFLARALYRNPSVLLLDEATSALDVISENAIIKTLINLRDTKGLTIVSVSHHPSTAVEADNIVVLKDGRIFEQGDYADLVAKKDGIFQQLVESAEEE